MSKGVGAVIGIVAAIAIPFAAPAIASAIGSSSLLAGTAFGSFLGTAGGAALTGAALGAGAGLLSGGGTRGALLGGLFGGIGGYAGAGGLSSLFGGSSAAAGTAGEIAGAGAAGTAAAAPSSAAVAALESPAFVGGVYATPAWGGGLSGTLSSLGSRLVSGITSREGLSALGRLAMTMYNKPVDELSPEQSTFLRETAELAATNRTLFNQRVEEARRLLQQGTPNPEQAFANARFQASRGLNEETRGLSTSESAAPARRVALESTRLGTFAVPQEAERAARYTQAGLSTMPTTAPQGIAGLSLPIYESLARRRDMYDYDLARSAGGLFGALAGSSKG